MRAETATSLRARFADYHLRIEDPGLLETLEPGQVFDTIISHRYGSSRYSIAYAPKMTMGELAPLDVKPGEHVLVVGPIVNERSAAMLRNAGIDYLDQAGNAHVSFDGVHIDVRGRRNPAIRPGEAVSRGGTNLFSPKRAQVIFALLTWPEMAHAPVRNLAHTAGTSVGQAQSTLELLADAGHLAAPGGPLRHTAELLERWASAFPTGLGSPSRQRNFAGDITDLQVPDGLRLAVSGESAVTDYLRPETLTIYTTGPQAKLISRNRWRSDQAPNIFIREQFWIEPPNEIPSMSDNSIVLAPPTLVYADLKASRDARQLEAAEWLRKNNDQLRLM